MEQFIGCNAHKKFSVFVAVNTKGHVSEAVRVAHDRELYWEFLSRLPARSARPLRLAEPTVGWSMRWSGLVIYPTWRIH